MALVVMACSRRAPTPQPAEEMWRWIQPRPTGNSLLAAWLDGSRAWAVGEAGTILRSDDGGASWISQRSGTTETLTGVTADSGGVIAVGEHGTILATTDGATWIAQRSPTTETLTGVWANGHGRIFAVGMHGVILASANGGGTWYETHSGTTRGLRAVRGVRDDIYAVGDNGLILYAEKNAGTWEPRSSGTTDTLTAVHVTQGGAVVAVGGSSLVRSDDGENFQLAGPPRGATLVGVGGAEEELWVTGTRGALFRSRDAGRSFESITTAAPVTLGAIAAGPRSAVAVGAFGAILIAAGNQVTDAAPAPRVLFTGVARHGGTVWIVGADGTILTGPESGPLTPVVSGTAGLLTSVTAGADAVIAVGASGIILRAAPGGPFQREPTPTERSLSGVASAGGRTLAVGIGGTVLERQSGNWQPVSSATAADLAAVWTDGTTTIAVGARGTMVRSSGGPFAPIPSGTTSDLLTVTGHGTDVWAAGTAGVILHSTDGGMSWSPIASGVTVDLTGAWLGPDGITLVGERGTRLVGTAVALTIAPSGTLNPLTEVVDGIAVGAGGTVLSYSKSIVK